MDWFVVRRALKASSPAFFGYIGLGLAFGFIFQKAGASWYFAPLMSLLVFAGAAQFIAVSIFAVNGSLLQLAVATFIVNLRHIFYGISFLGTFPRNFIKKVYMIFGLTDESYSILTNSKERHMKNYDFYVIAFSHSYWVLGSLLGSLLSVALPVNLSFLKFTLTALFVVMAVEQAYSLKRAYPFVVALVSSSVALYCFPSDMLLLAMALTTLFLFFGYIRERRTTC